MVEYQTGPLLVARGRLIGMGQSQRHLTRYPDSCSDQVASEAAAGERRCGGQGWQIACDGGGDDALEVSLVRKWRSS